MDGKALKFPRALVFVVGFLLLISIITFVDFRMTGSNALLSINEYGMYQLDVKGYLNQFVVAWNRFTGNNVTDFNAIPMDFSDVISTLKSIINIFICAINVLLYPFNFLGMVSEMILSLFGLASSDQNVIVVAVRTIVSISIPYLS